MNKANTLLAHLAMGLSKHPENIATEALAYVLQNSSVAAATFCKIAQSLGIETPDSLGFRTQVGVGAEARPDLIGQSPDGSIHLLVEAKFWAGLTDAQPNTYLQSLTIPGSGLIFIAPAQRLETLWAEVLRRCQEAGHGVAPTRIVKEWSRSSSLGGCIVALVSWRGLLAALLDAMEAVGETTFISDIRQLAGLCENMDTQAFIPLRADDFGPIAARRVVEFGEIAYELVELLCNDGLGDVRGLRPTSGNGWYGRYLRIKRANCCIYFSAHKWAATAETPLWLEIKGPDWQPSQIIAASLSRASITCFNSTDVPLYPKVGVERQDVIQDLLMQIRSIAENIPAALEDAYAKSETILGPPEDSHQPEPMH